MAKEPLKPGNPQRYAFSQAIAREKLSRIGIQTRLHSIFQSKRIK